MDAACYEDLAGRLYGLLIMLQDRLGGEQAQLLHHVIEAGEYGLALEQIAGALAQDTIAITDPERAGMFGLVRRMKMDDLVPDALGVCPRAAQPSAPGGRGPVAGDGIGRRPGTGP